MVMNYKEISRQVKEQDAKFKIGADLMDEFAGSLEKKGLLPKRLEEPGLPESKPQAKTEVLADSKDLQLQSMAEEYSTQPHTPELVTKFWQTFLETSVKGQGLDISIPVVSCDRTAEELEALKKEGRMWVPQTQLTYPQLGQIFPKMQSYTVQKDSPIKDEFGQDAKGVDVEVDADAPNRNTTQKDLENLFKKQGRKGMKLSTYILASQASKVLTDHYLDEGFIWSRLLGSRNEGFVVDANFGPDGCLYVGWVLGPRGRGPCFGGRSEGVKKA